MTHSNAFSALTDLIDTPIADVHGAVVGYVTDLLVDRHEGKIEYVRLCLEQEPGEVKRSITVPWSSICTARRPVTRWQLRVGKPALASLAQSNS